MYNCVLEAVPQGHGEGIAGPQIRDIGWVEDIAKDSTLAEVQPMCGYSDERDFVHERVHNLGTKWWLVRVCWFLHLGSLKGDNLFGHGYITLNTYLAKQIVHYYNIKFFPSFI